MTKSELAMKLSEMREAGEPNSNMSAMMYLFGIIFDKDIERIASNAAQIAKEAKCQAAEGAVADGRKLARYVTVKPEVLKHWRPDG